MLYVIRLMNINLIDLVESVQPTFSKRILLLSKLPYILIERFVSLGLESFELRRLRFDLINYFKVLNDLTPITSCEHFLIHHPIFLYHHLAHLCLIFKNHWGAILSSHLPFSTDKLTVGTSALCSQSFDFSYTSFKSVIKKVDLSSFFKGNSFKHT